MHPADAMLLHKEDTLFAKGLGITDFDASFSWKPVEEGDVVSSFGFKAIATPGHTPGSICWYNEGEGAIELGEKDLSQRQLAEFEDTFADIVNTLLLDGKRTIKPSELMKRRSSSSGLCSFR